MTNTTDESKTLTLEDAEVPKATRTRTRVVTIFDDVVAELVTSGKAKRFTLPEDEATTRMKEIRSAGKLHNVNVTIVPTVNEDKTITVTFSAKAKRVRTPKKSADD